MAASSCKMLQNVAKSSKVLQNLGNGKQQSKWTEQEIKKKKQAIPDRSSAKLWFTRDIEAAAQQWRLWCSFATSTSILNTQWLLGGFCSFVAGCTQNFTPKWSCWTRAATNEVLVCAAQDRRSLAVPFLFGNGHGATLCLLAQLTHVITVFKWEEGELTS